MVVRFTEQIECTSDSTTLSQWINSFHRKQQVFVANREAEILDKVDASQSKLVSSINRPADIGMRDVNNEEIKGNEWLNETACLK